jgi:hypothetical protein
MTSYQSGEVVLVSFPFTQSSQTKNRPALVLLDTGDADVLVARDYGEAAEAEMADKRADYFAAGTQVVWDVDPVAECVHVYHADNPTQATTYRRGEMAEAEAAVPGWRLAVDEIFSAPV